jgi:hypothetical protein
MGVPLPVCRRFSRYEASEWLQHLVLYASGGLSESLELYRLTVDDQIGELAGDGAVGC